MQSPISRRDFVKTSLLASAAVPLGLTTVAPPSAHAQSNDTMPTGKMGGQDFSRLMLGGNLIGGYSHSRDLAYVSTLMRRYNTNAKIRETLELAEAQGINCINTWVMQENQAIFDHWKNGGKIKWFSQVRLDEGGGFAQAQKAADQGAIAIHLTGDTCENLLRQGKFEKVGESLEFIKARKLIAGVAAHDLRVIVECEKLKLQPDFYQKTFHSLDYYTAPRPDEREACGAHDNSWCNDPDAVIEVMVKTTKPWIAFKILAAGAVQPRAAFPYAFNSGADFILVGMFDWQVQEDAQLAKKVVRIVKSPDSKRTRPWFS
jgi:hypothetical protein